MSNGLLYSGKFRQATWLELFFDLVFVAVIGVVTHDLAHTHHGHIGAEQLFRFMLVFVPVWWVWATHTMFSNRYDNDDTIQKLVTLGLMALVILLSTFIKDSLAEGFRNFVLVYVAMRVVLAAAFFFVPSSRGADAELGRKIGIAVLIGAVVSLLSVFVAPPISFVLLYGGLILDMVLQARHRDHSKSLPVHRKHLAERIGLLAIIILGETVISIVGSMAETKWDANDVLAAVAGFLLIASIWWIYFGSLHRLERAKRITTGDVIIYAHLPFYIGLVFLANMVRHSINGDLDRSTFALMSIFGLTLFYIGKQIPYVYAFPPYTRGIVINSAVCIGITVFSCLLPRTEYAMLGMMFGMLVYVQLNVGWLIPHHNIDAYLEDEE